MLAREATPTLALQFRILQPLLHLRISHYPCFGRLVLIAKWFDLAQRLAALTEMRGKTERRASSFIEFH